MKTILEQIDANINSLKDYISKENSRIREWNKLESDAKFESLITENLKFWASVGIDTVDDYKRHEIERYIEEAYEKIYRVRPAFLNLDAVPIGSLERFSKELKNKLDSSIEKFEKSFKSDMINFENDINNFIKSSEETNRDIVSKIMDIQDSANDALKESVKMSEAENSQEPSDAFEYSFRLPFGFVKTPK